MMDENILIQIIEAQDQRLNDLENQIDILAAEKAETEALLGHIVGMLSNLDSRTSEALAGLRAIQMRDTQKVGGTDWRPKL
jgi:hypothetical protein